MNTQPRARRTVVIGAAVLQTLVIALLYLPAGLLAPIGPWLFVNAGGVVGGILGLRYARRWRLGPLAVPVAAAVLWLVFLAAGGAIFDWTA